MMLQALITGNTIYAGTKNGLNIGTKQKNNTYILLIILLKMG